MAICTHIKHTESTTVLLIMVRLAMVVAHLLGRVGWLQNTLYFVVGFGRGGVVVGACWLVLKFGFGVAP